MLERISLLVDLFGVCKVEIAVDMLQSSTAVGTYNVVQGRAHSGRRYVVGMVCVSTYIRDIERINVIFGVHAIWLAQYQGIAMVIQL